MRYFLGCLLVLTLVLATQFASAQGPDGKCEAELQASEWQVKYTDAQRGAAVRDLAVARQNIAILQAQVEQLQREIKLLRDNKDEKKEQKH